MATGKLKENITKKLRSYFPRRKQGLLISWSAASWMSLQDTALQFLNSAPEYYKTRWFLHATWPPPQKINQSGCTCTQEIPLCPKGLVGLPDSGVPHNRRFRQFCHSLGTLFGYVHQPTKIVTPLSGFPLQSNC